MEAKGASRKINTWRFAVLAYFLVCGGPFGIEIAATAGGPLPTLLGFFLMPLLWSMPQVSRPATPLFWPAQLDSLRGVVPLPFSHVPHNLVPQLQAVMTAEMSALISDNGGYVVWAQAAFGDLAGWFSGVNGCLANVFDLALYPALAAEYAGEFTELTSTEVRA